MKFQQIHTFYPRYLNDFSRGHSQLATASFQEHINALVLDGFSGCHMFAPYMDAFGYESQLVIANYPASQSQWMRENNIRLNDETNWIFEIARHQVNTYNPDILYLSDSYLFDSNFVRSLNKRPCLIVGFRGAQFASTTDLSEFDVMMSNSTLILQQAKDLGARNVAWFYPGMPNYFVDAVRDENKQYDVVFTGSYSLDHQYRNQLLQFISAQTTSGNFTPHFFLNADLASIPKKVADFAYPALWGMDMYRVLKKAKIVFNAELDFAGTEAGNMRLFEATAVGSFVLTQHHDNIGEYFEAGIEIETFRTQGELYEKICYYLNHPEKREEIAQRGQIRALRDYTIEVRAKELSQIITSMLSKSKFGGHFNTLYSEASMTTNLFNNYTTELEMNPEKALPLVRQADSVTALSPIKQPVTNEQPPLENNNSAHSLKIEAQLLIGKHCFSEAFAVLIKAKALKEPLENLDYLRALCFLKLNQEGAALEALKEELRYFPGNGKAVALLQQVHEQMIPSLTPTDDAEFNQLLNAIHPYTMLSEARLYSLFALAKEICTRNIPGNFVECGVAAGGSSALLACVIKRYSRMPRRLFSFDSFSGMPKPGDLDTHHGLDAEATGWGTGTCAAPEESVRDICKKLGVEDVLTTVKGYFEETLPQMRDWVGMIALLHMDGDWYDSTRAILHNLYDRLVNGALIQVDDYGHWDGCRKAIDEFATARSLQFDLKRIDGTGVWFTKPDTFRINQEIPKNIADDFIQDDPVSLGIASQMSANERFQLYYSVRTLLPMRQKPIRFIEIGSYSGASLMLTCKAFQRLGTSYQGISVEPGGTRQFHEVIDILKQNVIHISLFSHEAPRQLNMMFSADNLPVFIFVDGDHTYEGVRQDIIDYYELLAPGGIMLFHDYLPELEDINRAAIYHHHGNAEPGIRRACREVLEDYHKLRHIELPLLYPEDPTQTQAHLPIIPGVFSTVRAYRKPLFCNVERQPLNIVLISTSTGGGAGIAAVRLNQALLENRIESSVITLVKNSSDPAVKVIHDWGTSVESGTSSEANVAFESWRAIAINHPERPWGLEMFSNPDSAVNLANIDEVKRADIVHLHWIAGLADYDEMALALKGKKIVWTLHDMNPFTGGCHYTNSCDRYFQSCGACPQLGSRVEEDLSRMNWLKKYRSLQQLDITVVTPSRWLARCVAQSSILGNARVVTIPNGIPTHIFKPYDRDEVRESLQISLDAKVILFGAESIANTRKGFVYLLEALKRYREPSGQKVILVTFGSLDPSVVIDSPYPLLQLGRIKDESHLACIYSMADVTVIPSLEDNLPNVILESMSSGTPVLGFNIGGIPDMVDHLSTGYVARARDVDDLMNGIQWMFDNVSSNMRAKCRDKVIKCFSYSVCSQRMKILYTSLCSSTV